MAWTVYYTKNGVQRAIKVSILDAFRGVPDRKPPKPKPCSCCGEFHKRILVCETAHQPPFTKVQEDKKGGDDDLTNDDRIMLRLKAENPTRPWSDILEATGFKGKSEAQARWKMIEHKGLEVAQAADSKKKQKLPKDKDPDKEAKIAKDREEGLKRQAEAKAQKQTKATKASKGDAKTEGKNGKSGSAKKDNSSPNDLKNLAETYDKKKWQMMASKHYDKTGQRITAAQAKAMAEGK